MNIKRYDHETKGKAVGLPANFAGGRNCTVARGNSSGARGSSAVRRRGAGSIVRRLAGNLGLAAIAAVAAVALLPGAQAFSYGGTATSASPISLTAKVASPGRMSASASSASASASLPASNWDLTKKFPAGISSIDGVSCPASSICTALATNDTGLEVALYSTDGGASWQVGTFPTVVPDESSYPIFFLSCGSSANCAAVETSGTTLLALADPVFAGLLKNLSAQSPPAAFYTTNGGMNWTTATLPSGINVLTDLSCGSASDCAATGFINGKTAMLHSANGGMSWEPASLPATPGLTLLRVACYTPLSGTGSTQPPVKCLSAGSPLSALMPVLRSVIPGMQQLPGISSSSSSQSFLPLTFASTDGGAVWTQGPSLPGDTGLVTSISCSNGTSVCIMTGSKFEMYSATSGATWAESTLPASAGTPTDVSCYSPSTCVLATASGNIYRSIDGGASWNQAGFEPAGGSSTGGNGGPGIIGWASVSCSSVSSCSASFLGFPGLGSGQTYLYFSADGGNAWQASTMPVTVDGIGTIYCTPSGICIAVSSTHIIYTQDAGSTWTIASAPSGVSRINAISCTSSGTCIAIGTIDLCFDPTSAACLATQQDVSGSLAPIALYSTDSGQSWAEIALPLGMAAPKAVSCSSSQSCVIEGATHIVYSSDGGKTWKEGTLPSEIGGALSLSGSVSCSGTTCNTVGAINGSLAAFYSLDGGATWSESSLQGSAPIVAANYGNIDILGNMSLEGFAYVSCKSGGACTMVGGPAQSKTSAGTLTADYDFAYTSSNDGESWSVASIQSNLRIQGITCTGDYCLASTSSSNNAGVLSLLPGGGGVQNTQAQNTATLLSTTDGGASWGTATTAGIQSLAAVEGVSCISVTNCIAVGSNTQGYQLPSLYGGVIYQNTSPFSPSISTLSPGSSPIAGGTVVTISGAGFSGASKVDFGSTPAASFGIISSSTLTATAPTVLQPGLVNVTVTTPLGITAPAGFLYVATGNRYIGLTPYRIADTRCTVAAFVDSMPKGYCSNVPSQNRSLAITGSGTPVTVQVGGTGLSGDSVPTDAEAVVVNVTAVSTGDTSGTLTVYPTGTPVPAAPSLDFSLHSYAGYSSSSGPIATSSLSTVALGMNNSITIYPSYFSNPFFENSAGTSGTGTFGQQPSPLNVVVDVEGYYAPATAATGGAGGLFTPVDPPVRVLDTRCSPSEPDSIPLLPSFCSSEPTPPVALGALGSKQSVAVQVAGLDGIPAVGVDAVSMTVTVANPGGGGYATVWPDMNANGPVPMTSNINFSKGHNRANQIISAVGTGGYVRMYNSAAAPIDVVIDVNGYYSSSGYQSGYDFTPSTPIPICSTASAGITEDAGVVSGVAGQCDGSGNSLMPKTSSDPALIQAAGLAGIPAGADGVVTEITVNGTPASILNSFYLPPGSPGYISQSQLNGYLTAWAGNSAMPTTSYLNWSDGSTVTGMVMTGLDGSGAFDAYTSSPADLTIDVTGWFQG